MGGLREKSINWEEEGWEFKARHECVHGFHHTDMKPAAHAYHMRADQVEVALREARLSAEQLGVAVNIALVDLGGNLTGFLRMPGAFLASIELAIDKAYSAVSFGMSTRSFGDMLDQVSTRTAEGLRRRPNVTDVAGGFPILSGGEMLGGIGVSGASEDEDEQIAEAAGKVFSAKQQQHNFGEYSHGA